MPVLQCYVSDEDLAQLQHVSKILGRSVSDLAESAISEQACQSIRDYGKPVVIVLDVKGTLEQLVRNAFENAEQNGQTFEDWNDEQIAIDMLDCDADIEGHELSDVTAAVTKVRNEILLDKADQKHTAQQGE